MVGPAVKAWRQRWRVNTRSMKFSLSSGSCNRPSSSAGTRGNRWVNARAKSPTPFFSGIPLSLYTLTRIKPLEGESFLKTKPHRSSPASRSSRARAQVCIRSVWSIPVREVTRRGASSSPTRRNVSRGTGRPHSTSGQTGTHSTNRPSVSVRNGSLDPTPFQRTFSPSRQALIPILIGSCITTSYVAPSGAMSPRQSQGCSKRKHETLSCGPWWGAGKFGQRRMARRIDPVEGRFLAGRSSRSWRSPVNAPDR